MNALAAYLSAHTLPGGGAALPARIADIDVDSREVTPGGAFIATAARDEDGQLYAKDAAQRGASAVITREAPSAELAGMFPGVCFLQAKGDIREIASAAAALCYPSPSLRYACGVTGTNGKTSVAHIFRCAAAALSGEPALSAGTLGVIFRRGEEEEVYDFGLTTPDPVTLHKKLSAYTEKRGARYLCMETSSHGLDQRRADGVRFNAAIFTNFTQDHLDYHGTKEAYFAAKLRLFGLTRTGGAAVINADMPECAAAVCAAEAARLRPVTCGYAEDAALRILSRTDIPGGGQEACIAYQGASYRLRLSLSGAFQAYNAAFAFGALCDAFPGREADIAAVMASIPEIAGRMQRISVPEAAGEGPAVYADFAHTADALENALRALRPQTRGRLIIVFGCGGDRDAGKRPLMGAAASALADKVIVTDDNPRTENAATIRAEILAGCDNTHAETEEITPRAAAVHAAIRAASAADTVLLAGKGHEPYQIIGAEKQAYSDIAEAEKALRARCCGV